MTYDTEDEADDPEVRQKQENALAAFRAFEDRTPRGALGGGGFREIRAMGPVPKAPERAKKAWLIWTLARNQRVLESSSFNFAEFDRIGRERDAMLAKQPGGIATSTADPVGEFELPDASPAVSWFNHFIRRLARFACALLAQALCFSRARLSIGSACALERKGARNPNLLRPVAALGGAVGGVQFGSSGSEDFIDLKALGSVNHSEASPAPARQRKTPACAPAASSHGMARFGRLRLGCLALGFLLCHLAFEALNEALVRLPEVPKGVTLWSVASQFACCTFAPLALSLRSAETLPRRSLREWAPFAMISAMVFLSNSLSQYSTHYVEFTLKIVAKSSKLLPTMLISGILGNSGRFEALDYAVALLLCAGTCLFCLDQTGGCSQVPNLQQRALKSASCAEVMARTNLLGALTGFLGVVLNGDASAVLEYAGTHPRLLWLIPGIGLTLAGSVLCYTELVHSAGSVFAVGVGTLRKSASLLLSYLLFPKAALGVERVLGLVLLGLGLVLAEWRARSPKRLGATRLRSALLSQYDSVVPPISDRLVNYSGAGTDVGMQIRFFKVDMVAAATGHMRLKVWVRLSWVDQRLSWDPADYGNITQVVFRAGGLTDAENSEIWVPDIELYNAKDGIQATLEKAAASVTSSGSVFWSRPGMLDTTMCKFSGLVAFPLDTLSCAMEWGGWGYSGGFQGIYLLNGGYAFLQTEDTAGSSYQEYSIQDLSVEIKTNFYEFYPAEPWTQVKYVIKLQRASFYYWLLIMLPTVLITYLSFGVFFMSHEVGERLSFGITLLLVVEVMKGTVATFVPVCGELLWIDLFMVVNTLFCCSSLLETMLVLFFAFHADEHVLPNWLAWLAPWVLCRRKISARTSIESTAGNIYRRLSQDCLDGKRKGRQTAAGERMKEIASSKLTETDTAKLIFFENLFYMLDSDSNGLITTEDVCSMLSFVNLSMEWTDLEIFLRSSWPADKLFNCSDFLEICVELMWTIPFQEIKMGAENYTSSCNRHIKRCQNHWQRWSKAIDRGSRFWLPLLYTTALGILLNLEFVDDYGSAGSVMFEGFGPIVVPPSGVVSALVTPTIGLRFLLSRGST
ncbi:unnamed protein product [Effrenium voratum]|uniref:EF-hand domain-containing protein n=1 Tax=Effrenium voratum TaxID=2562239 RepID=A0AA36MQJ9_9DINO|nr:unnamed protein product [Effrenium voratum]